MTLPRRAQLTLGALSMLLLLGMLGLAWWAWRHRPGQQVATWPETGIGLLYGQTNGARICLSRHEDDYVAVNAHHIAGSSAMTVGDIVLTPGFTMNKQER